MSALKSQIKVTAIDSSFADDGIVGAMRSGPLSSGLTQQAAQVMFRQGQFLQAFSRTKFSDLREVRQGDGASQWEWQHRIGGVDHRVSLSNADIIGSVRFTEVRSEAEIDEIARKYDVSRGDTFLVIDGKRYFVNMSIPLHFLAPGGNNALINLGLFVLGAEGIGAAIAAVASAAGIAAFTEVWAGISTGLFTVLWTALSGAVQVAYAFAAAFVGELIGGAEIGAALVAAQAASGELIAGGVFSAITGAALAYTLVGLLVIALIFVILEFVLHQSYQNVYVYNLTDKDLEFDFGYIYEGAAHNLSAKRIPARTKRVGPGNVPLGSWYNGTAFRFQSDSQFHGIGYALIARLYEPGTRREVDNFACMFDIPFVGDNSLNAVAGLMGSAEAFYRSSEGKHTTTQLTARAARHEMVVTYDFLSGKHKDPETGDNEYLYNSLIVIRPI
ncbi:hypothetical protein [Caulobacter endophyticus]|uniref:hypothetical protein n=1 Tax=Caulobacter endophyticus TaxID=2172652 RepID=UPI00240F3FD2|nr:hypothetical protein [Caulobacter endophyticus]MDG2531324.1 hypothetical protein [Caulobacter endophyticus]